MFVFYNWLKNYITFKFIIWLNFIHVIIHMREESIYYMHIYLYTQQKLENRSLSLWNFNTNNMEVPHSTNWYLIACYKTSKHILPACSQCNFIQTPIRNMKHQVDFARQHGKYGSGSQPLVGRLRFATKARIDCAVEPRW